jgi:uncharacterized protein Smg (DUF494 family)
MAIGHFCPLPFRRQLVAEDGLAENENCNILIYLKRLTEPSNDTITEKGTIAACTSLNLYTKEETRAALGAQSRGHL